MRRPFILLLLMLGLGLCGVLVHDRPPEERLEAAAATLQKQVGQAYGVLHAKALAALGTDSLPRDAAHTEGGMRLYRGGAMVSWTDHAPITDAMLDTARTAHLYLPDGIYLHAFAEQDDRRVHAVQRLWFQPPFQNQYLQEHFDQGFSLEQGIRASAQPGLGPVVRDAQGEVMLRLEWSDNQQTGGEAMPGARTLAGILFMVGAFICGAAILWLLALRLKSPWAATVLFSTVLLGLQYINLAQGGFRSLANYPVFDPSLFASSFLSPSLGDLLINTALLLFSVLFIRRALRHAPVPRPTWPWALLAVSLLFLSATAITSVMASLVHDSRVGVDLFQIQEMNAYGVLALLAVGLLLLAWSILAETAVRLFAGRVANGHALWMATGLALALILINHLRGNYDLLLSLWPLPALVLVHRLHQRPGTIPALGLIAVMAFITAHVLNRETFKRIETDRRSIAESAITMEDPVIEHLFEEARAEMQRDGQLMQWVRSGGACNSSELDRMVRQSFFSGYWDRYDLRLHLIGPDGRSFCTTSPDAASSARSVMARFEQGVPTGSHHDLRITGRPGEDALYMGQVMLDSTGLLVELRPRLVADGLGFPGLLLAGKRPSLLNQNRFVQAQYARGMLTASSGSFVFPVQWTREVPPDGLYWEEGGHDLLAQGDPHGLLVVLGSPIPTWWDHLTTFSYLFLFYTLLATSWTALEFLVRRRRITSMGVSGKVRLGVAGFALVGLLLFAFGLFRMIDVRQQQRSNRTLIERSRGVLTELRQTLRSEDTLPPSIAPYMDHLLTNLSNVFFTDLNLYAPDGQLFATSREQVFNAGLLGRRMDPRAYQRLAGDGASSYIGREHIGNASFTTTYVPFRNDQGRVLAYLALPYFARQAEVEQARASGYVAMVNIFTLLFLLSAVAATLIAHWTTRPLRQLRLGLERIDLGARNEPIAYRGDDELGQLVRVYNTKVGELRESALKLARSERESAWREMAKQVAHEIKNPLTPMKLNIQQFQRAWDPQAPDAKERLDRFSSGLVEQINVLSRIAGEFSHFAQIPPARPEQVDLVEVARTAVQLFADTPTGTVGLHGEAPLPVLADREHLLRVFNNLIKNALQALPDGNEGCVDVLLRQEGNKAVAEVRDNGTGIAPENRDRIFEPSFTTKGSGMGLGLAMVKRMVENAGGRVWFETQEGHGTSFFVALPLCA